MYLVIVSEQHTTSYFHIPSFKTFQGHFYQEHFPYEKRSIQVVCRKQGKDLDRPSWSLALVPQWSLFTTRVVCTLPVLK